MTEFRPVKLAIPCALLIASLGAFAQSTRITPQEAKDHAGQLMTVCGKVVNPYDAASTKGQPTFLNLDEPYPREIFTTLIWVVIGQSSEPRKRSIEINGFVSQDGFPATEELPRSSSLSLPRLRSTNNEAFKSERTARQRLEERSSHGARHITWPDLSNIFASDIGANCGSATDAPPTSISTRPCSSVKYKPVSPK